MYWYNTFFGSGPLPKNLTSTKLAEYETDMEFQNILAILLNLFTDIFEYSDFPGDPNYKALEASFIWRAAAGYVPYYGTATNTGAAMSGGFNVNGRVTKFWSYGWNGWSKEFQNYIEGSEVTPELAKGAGDYGIDATEVGVFGRDNYYLYPMSYVLIQYCSRIANAMRDIDMISFNLTWPGILEVPDEQRKTVEALLEKRKVHKPIVIGRDQLSQISAEMINFNIQPATLDTMWDHVNRLTDRIMEYFGIESNPTIGKAERVNTQETSANNARTLLSIDNRLREREEFCENVRKVFGGNPNVKINSRLQEEAQEARAALLEAQDHTPGTGDDNDNSD